MKIPFLTNKQEIERLLKVVEEKNKEIEAFKQYDRERKAYYAQFENDYKTMKHAFDILEKDINEYGKDAPKAKVKRFKRLYGKWLGYQTVAEKTVKQYRAIQPICSQIAKYSEKLLWVSLSAGDPDYTDRVKQTVSLMMDSVSELTGVVAKIGLYNNDL